MGPVRYVQASVSQREWFLDWLAYWLEDHGIVGDACSAVLTRQELEDSFRHRGGVLEVLLDGQSAAAVWIDGPEAECSLVALAVRQEHHGSQVGWDILRRFAVRFGAEPRKQEEAVLSDADPATSSSLSSAGTIHDDDPYDLVFWFDSSRLTGEPSN